MTDMKASYLIQRLEPPWGGFGPFKDSPFSFGGGYKHGGLSDEAMDLIRGVFSFDYMGAAEFEFGAVPKALSEIANHKHLAASSFTIPLSKVPEPYVSRGEEKPDPPEAGARAAIYVLSPEKWQDEIMGRIVGWATDSYKGRLKEPVNLTSALRPSPKYPTRVCGWLELDNGFFFFTNVEMWKRTCDLFGVKMMRPSHQTHV